MKIYEAYGQSEPPPSSPISRFDEHAGFFGKAEAPCIKIALLNEDGSFCEDGEEGEVCISVENSGTRPWDFSPSITGIRTETRSRG